MKRFLILVLLSLSIAFSCKAECSAKSKLYTKDNVKLLSQIIHHEAGYVEHQATRKLVGVVVLKRMKSPLFPNTMRGVLFQPNQYMSEYALSKVVPNKVSIKTAKKLLKKGYKGIKKYPDNLLFHSNFIQGDIYKYSDGVYFCLRRG